MKTWMLLAALFSSLPLFATSADLLKKISGKWYGEVPGIYKINLDAGEYLPQSPWRVMAAKVKIEEGEVETLDLAFSRNLEAHFLTVTRGEPKQEEVFTLSAGLLDKMTFSRLISVPGPEYREVSTNEVQLSLENETLTFAFRGGDGYRIYPDGRGEQFATGDYRPFHLKRVK